MKVSSEIRLMDVIIILIMSLWTWAILHNQNDNFERIRTQREYKCTGCYIEIRDNERRVQGMLNEHLRLHGLIRHRDSINRELWNELKQYIDE